MSRMAIRLRTASFAMLLGLGASNAFAQSPADFIEQASAKGMADIETSRMAHAKTSSQEIKDYTIEVINERTLANQHLAAIAKKLDLPVAPRDKIVDKAESLMPELKDGDSFDAAYTAQQIKANEDAIALFKQEGAESDIPEIKALVDETLPKLEERLGKARALASTYGKGHQGDG
ncbi:MAG: DUF4142 domain-containing protein [Pseudomonas sp.]|jgi:putative membrane protein|uniref:DUF4142 domain-containing protein n=1 Tax=Pseudomonas sp. TaxID=306 RepID=UPI0023A610D7|nr:DUF4142 domain-containing protein [Pseudomonas sp.]MDP9057918.1 DUF4142 domain-containing protein [Pseudomonadota bacterium]MDE1908203.1 DUF4142 domain-containing protein [Pseudomonas sp.]MDE2190112.1 DUF4142 domain-containing protein [Pseudomonas sp.]MDE2557146.1 DUF4142 domain-containing protein [Pseudomonas sp.]MDP9213908.1 DUF4142 domain-containing protein [Pseudomonadota bacterium]